MSNIIEFRLPADRVAPSELPRNPGQILFFTGIRYMRDDEPAEAPSLRDLIAPVVDDADDASERLKA